MYLNLIAVIYSRSFTLYIPQFMFADIKFEMKLFFMYVLLYYNRYFWKISSLNGMKLRRKTKVLLPFYLSRKFILQEKMTQFFSLSSKKKKKLGMHLFNFFAEKHYHRSIHVHGSSISSSSIYAAFVIF